MKGDDLYKEREHIKFWDNCLNDLKKQFDIMSNFFDTLKKRYIGKKSELENILIKYKKSINKYSKEPSHLINLPDIYIKFLSFLWDIMNKYNDELYSKINSMNSEIIKDLDIKKDNLYKNNISLIDECQALMNEIKIQENEYNKKKEIMNEAQINRNKIKNEVQYLYNVSENKKVDLQLAKSIIKMEEIKIPMEENKKKLKEFKTALITSFSQVFEDYFSLYFKHLAILYQYFYLLENNKMDILLNFQKQINNTLSQISNLNFESNDYTEKKFGELINIKYDGLILLDSEELLNNANPKLLLKISYDIINYVKVFMICLKYRKKIMKHFYETIRSINKLELNIQSENILSYNNLLNQLKSIKISSEGTSKRWNYLIMALKKEENNTNYELLVSWIEDYINFISHEFNEFDINWREYEEKIIENQNIIREYIKEINNIKIVKCKVDLIHSYKEKNENFRQIIKDSIQFTKNNINNIRNKDKNKMHILSNSFEKMILKYKNLINKNIYLTEIQISSLATLDIYEESKVAIIKYFNDAKIRNYMGFLEKIRYKLISQFQVVDDSSELEKEKEFDQSKENKLLPNDTLNSNDIIEENKSQIFQENNNNKDEETEINNLNLLFKDSRKFLFENNTNNRYTFNSILNKENNNNNEILEKNILNNNKNIDKISLDLLNRNKFTELTKIENPYQNIKEEELIKLKEINTKKDDEEFDQGEIILDNFNCALKDTILLQGKFFITNKRIWFRSLFNPSTLFGKTTIMIPLIDIISIEKKYYLALDNSIEVKTEKISYFFTNYLSRDKCFDLLQLELNKIKQNKSFKSNNKRIISDKKINSNNNTIQNTKIEKFNKIYYRNFLKDIDFEQKLKLITEERIKYFGKKYRDEKNLIFLEEKNFFSEKFFEHEFKSCPLFICFKYICKASTQLDELGFSKGFFESIILQNFSKDVILIEKEGDENDIESWKLPSYFDDDDYVLNLFSSYDNEKFLMLLNETQNWIPKYEYNCYGMNKKIQKNSKSDLYITYFISPSLLIFDIILFSTTNHLLNNYIPIFRYKFDSNIKFNETNGKFDINTKLTVLFDIYYSINCILSTEEKNKICVEYKKKFREYILGKLIDVINNYSKVFRDKYDKIAEENIEKKLKIEKNRETVNEFEYNDNNSNNKQIDEFEEIEKNNIVDDIKTIKSIEINNTNININITNSNNSNINSNINNNGDNKIDNMNQLNKKENKEEMHSEIKKEEKNMIKDIKLKINLNKTNIILFIIIILIMVIFLLSFLKIEKILINIINLICLGLAIFLLVKGK